MRVCAWRKPIETNVEEQVENGERHMSQSRPDGKERDESFEVTMRTKPRSRPMSTEADRGAKAARLKINASNWHRKTQASEREETEA